MSTTIKLELPPDMQHELSHVMAAAIAALNYIIDDDPGWAGFAVMAAAELPGGTWGQPERDLMKMDRDVLVHLYVALDHVMGHPVFGPEGCGGGHGDDL